ncbi:MAG: MCE family protein [Bacteroidetes bacterium]|nr:MCE family protein [Bacteroidota bacterium]
MKEQSMNRVKLGAFVLIATLLLILGLYYIGSKKNIFHSTISVKASFNNVGGLLPGNNVRFNGINVGTISKVYAVADSLICVDFKIDKDVTQYIHKNAVASIGTDGLLGNKLINISPGHGQSAPLEEGDELASVNPIQMDNALRTLTMTNDNLKEITDNLKGVSEKFNADNSLWKLLTDTTLAANVKNAIVKFKLTGENTAIITGDLSRIVQDVKKGKGSIGALLTDTAFSTKLNQTIVNIHSISDTLGVISGNFSLISSRLKNGQGTVGMLLTDTTFVHNLNQSMNSIKTGTGSFSENMEALKHSWPFKKYFRKQQKANKTGK